MTWAHALAAVEAAAINASTYAVVGLTVAWVKLWPMWRAHRDDQRQILKQQDLILQRVGDPEENPIS